MPSFASLLALAALALPLASASAHYSHPRRHHEAAPLGTVRYRSNRSLPRSGRRLSKRGGGEATLKCLSTKTFALCDGDKCTDMGAVAAGTACIDNKITWDTEHEASAQDSSAATAASIENEEPVSSSPIASTSAVEVSITQKLVNNAAVQTTTSAPVSSKTSSSAPAPTADAGVNLNVNPSAGSSDSASDAFGDDDDEECDSEDTEDGDDDEECDSDEIDASASSSSAWTASTSSSSTPSQTPAAAPSSSSKPSSSSAAVSSVNLIASQAAPTTTTTTQAPAPTTTTTTTTTAAAQTSAASSGGSSSSSGGNWIQGKATFFYQGGAAGACGKVHADSDKIVALSLNLYGSASNSAPDCGRQIEIKNEATGQSTVATVADACPGCDDEHLDLSVGAFDAIGKQEQGVVPISWKFIS